MIYIYYHFFFCNCPVDSSKYYAHQRHRHVQYLCTNLISANCLFVYCLGQQKIYVCLQLHPPKKQGRYMQVGFPFYFNFSFYFTYGNSRLRTYPYPEKVPYFRIYLIALRCEGVIIPHKNCCGRTIKKMMPIIFQDVTGNSFFQDKDF